MKNELNIVFLDASTLGEVEAIDQIKKLGNYTSYEVSKPEEVIERVKGKQIVITNKVFITREVIEASPEMKLICISATGINNIDLVCAKEKGIEVKNVAGYSTSSVAQTTFSMLLHLLNSTAYFDSYVKSGAYSKSPIFTNHERSFWELKDKQYGIIGLGTIGKEVAKIATAFGARVVYYSTSGKNTSAPYPMLSLKELLSTSDVVSIHCPLNEKTINLIGYEQLKLMKKSAILINVGRGTIVNETELAKALNENLISSAGIDVLESEPINADNALLTLDNPNKILITPHIAWISIEARTQLVNGIYKNIVDWIN